MLLVTRPAVIDCIVWHSRCLVEFGYQSLWTVHMQDAVQYELHHTASGVQGRVQLDNLPRSFGAKTWEGFGSDFSFQ